MNKIVALFMGLAFWGCSEVAVTGRKQMNLLPNSMMTEMGLSNYSAYLTENKKAIITTGPEVELVKKVGNKIAQSVTSYLTQNGLGKQAAEFKWEFNVVKDDTTVNAWCMPGGKVVVYTGLLPVAKTEAGLAVVMGHEIAHAVANHGNERMSQGLLAQFGTIALDMATVKTDPKIKNIFMTSVGMGTQLGILLPFSRLQESESDKMGLIFMAMSGYDPNEAVTFWGRMAAASGGQAPPQFLSTHPSSDKRAADLKAYIPEAMKYYVKP
ncbi:MAG: M48 family metallopeptidase [Bacteroidetes bacterium]|jgi:predicted Zn-dependent protease|nr:M48 family metallopeptidase [Bacteroidota bacterium]MBK7139090.1 M48 family metallopeptidase [Bacteroidota bacterium]MBK7506245.1 M48 family metallopeptidase [Bacteroidota bacterium]MBK7639672.1 M48 family metallopeptidase [Bacteroidota bacterium]MBK8672575.1 M48 family metallopeptidase [Bacteroidota bacterium]